MKLNDLRRIGEMATLSDYDAVIFFAAARNHWNALLDVVETAQRAQGRYLTSADWFDHDLDDALTALEAVRGEEERHEHRK
jgi:hypothetical protein